MVYNHVHFHSYSVPISHTDVQASQKDHNPLFHCDVFNFHTLFISKLLNDKSLSLLVSVSLWLIHVDPYLNAEIIILYHKPRPEKEFHTTCPSIFLGGCGWRE